MESQGNNAASGWHGAPYDNAPYQYGGSNSAYGMPSSSATQDQFVPHPSNGGYEQQSMYDDNSTIYASGAPHYYGIQESVQVPQASQYGLDNNIHFQPQQYQGSINPGSTSYSVTPAGYNNALHPASFASSSAGRAVVDPSLYQYSSPELQSTLSRQPSFVYGQAESNEYTQQTNDHAYINQQARSAPPQQPGVQLANQASAPSQPQTSQSPVQQTAPTQHPVARKVVENQGDEIHVQPIVSSVQPASAYKEAAVMPAVPEAKTNGASPVVSTVVKPKPATIAGAVLANAPTVIKQEPTKKPATSKSTTKPAKDSKQATTNGSSSWLGSQNLVIGSPKELTDAASIARLKRQPLTVRPRDKLLFTTRLQPIPAEIRGRMQAIWDRAPIHFKDDLELIKQRAKFTLEKLGRLPDDKFLDDKQAEAAASKVPESKDLLTMSAEVAVAKVEEYLRLDDGMASNDALRVAAAAQFLRLFKALRMGLKTVRAGLDAAVEKKASPEEIQANVAALIQRRTLMEAVINASLRDPEANTSSVRLAKDKLLGAIAKGNGDAKSSTIGQLCYLLVNDLLKPSEALPTDTSSDYAKAILEFLVRLEPTMEELEELKFKKLVVAKYKGVDDKQIQSKLNEIVKNAEELAEEEKTKKQEQGKKVRPAGADAVTAKGAAKKPAVAGTRVPSASSPLKRRLEDGADSRAPKKAATSAAPVKPSTGTSAAPSAAPIASKPSSTPSLFSKVNIAQPTKPRDAPVIAAAKIAAGKPVAASADDLVVVDTSSIKDMPLPSFKKHSANPSAPHVADARASNPEPPKPVAKAPVAAPTQSKFASLLADIQEPKKVAKPEKVREPTPDPDETPEQRAKRLRKQERRKLRVSWKEGDALTQVRVFKKDANEEEDDDSGTMKRDARDDKAEGMQLKLALAQASDDDEEEDELPYRPWVEPSPIGPLHLPATERGEPYKTRGGAKEFHTEQQRLMEQREMRELMVIYTDSKDIPESAKSPLLGANESNAPVPEDVYLPNTEPQFREVHQRWAESRQLGTAWAEHSALKRLQNGGVSAQGQQLSAGTPTAPVLFDPAVQAARDAEVIRMLSSEKARNWKEPRPIPPTQRLTNHPNPDVQRAADVVEAIAALLRSKPYPPTEPPEWLQDPARIKEWWDGYQRDVQRKAEESRQAELAQQAQAQAQLAAHAVQNQAMDPATAQAWAAYYASQTAQAASTAQPPAPAAQQAYAQAYAAYQQQQQQPAANAPLNPQIHDLLAALQGGANNAPPPPPSTAGQPNLQMQQIMAALAASQQGGQYAPPPPPILGGGDANAAMIQDLLRAAGTGQAANPYAAYTAAQQGQQQSADLQRTGSWDAYGKDQKGYEDESRAGRRDKSGGGGGRRGGQGGEVPAHLKNINRALIGTKPCMYYRQGKCTKGELCTFRHD